MIDIENQVFTKVATALRSSFSGIDVKSVTTFTPASFPCACIEEVDNASYRASRDSGSNENHADLMYEVNVYSNKKDKGKSECKAIFAAIDGVMERLGFTRSAKYPAPYGEPMTYRLVGRYSAVVSQNNVIYRR